MEDRSGTIGPVHAGPTARRFTGRRCLVTGAGAGIGRAIATWLAAEGGVVIAADVNLAAAEETARSDVCMSAIGLDVRSQSSVDQMLASLRELSDIVDVLVNNAGIEELGTVSETTPERWDEVMSVDLRGVYLVSRAVLTLMPGRSSSRQAGAIVNVASLMGIVSSRRLAAYCAAKAGVVSLTRSMALDLAPKGIRVNCVCPGIIETSMLRRRLGIDEERAVTTGELQRIPPIGYIGTPGDVAAAVAFLASSESRFTTGSALVIDGGVGAE